MQLLVLLEQPQAPRDALLEVGVPGGVVLQPERRPAVQVIEEEEHRVRIARQPDLRRGDVREHGQRHAIVIPAERVAERSQERHRRCHRVAGQRATRCPPKLASVPRAKADDPDTSVTCIDAEPSCSTTMSTPARERRWRRRAAGPARRSSRSRRAGWPARTTTRRRSRPAAESAAIGDREAAASPPAGVRSATPRRASSSAGAASSHRNCGAPKAIVLTPCARVWRLVSLRVGLHDRRTPSAPASAALPSSRPAAVRPDGHESSGQPADRRQPR